jgi:Tol biopolymer transport system component
MRSKRMLVAMGAVITAALIAGACASKADAPTDTPVSSLTGAPATSQAAAATATPSSADAYIAYRDDTGTLAVRNFTTAKTYHQPVNPTTEIIAQMRCTPNGSRIAYLKQNFADVSSRQVIVRGTNAPRDPIRVSSLVQWIAWSPDGNKLALVEWDGQAKKGTIKIHDVAADSETTIMEGNQYIGNIAWSPDGTKLAFYLQSADFRESDIHTLNIDGSNLKRLTDPDSGIIWLDPDWAPDGSWIIAAGEKDQSVQLYRIDASTSEVTPLTSSSDIYKRNPYFAPDGSLVAFTGSVVLPSVSANWAAALHQFAIFTMGPDGAGEKSLTADPRGTTPGPNDPFLNAYMLGWCADGPWLDDLWEAQP